MSCLFIKDDGNLEVPFRGLGADRENNLKMPLIIFSDRWFP